MKYKQAIFCEHANEVPARCVCEPNCYCKRLTCKPKVGVYEITAKATVIEGCSRPLKTRFALPRPLENPIRDAIKQLLETLGHWVEVNGVSKKDGERTIHRVGFGPGSPDLLVITRKSNTAIWLEVKRDEKAKLRPKQAEWHAKAKARSLHVFTVWTPQMALDAVKECTKMHTYGWVPER